MISANIRKYVFDQVGYKPHTAEQRAVHDSTARFKVLACGRRWGKTTFGAMDMTAAVLDPEQAGYYWIVGPNYVQGEKEFRIVHYNVVHKLGLGTKIKKQYNIPQGLMRMEFPWGTILEVKSAERQESLLGEGLKGVIMSEAARHSVATWEQYIRPALSDRDPITGERGWAIFTSTPKGYNWFQGLFNLGITGEEGYQSWRLPSWANTLTYPGGREDPEIKEMEDRVSPQYFLQEIAAEFTAFAGKIYDEFDPDIHVDDFDFNPEWINFWTFDYGWNNPFVCLDIQLDEEDNVYVWREYHKSHLSSWDHGHLLQDPDRYAGQHNVHRVNPPGFHVDGFFGDPRGGDSRYTLELVLGPIQSDEPEPEDGNSTWQIGIELVKRWLKVQANGKPKLFISQNCPTLIMQMDQLHAPDQKENLNAKEEQHKYNDHGCDALRYFFAQYFGLGYGQSLSDIYPPGQSQSEAAGFFRQHSTLTRNARF